MWQDNGRKVAIFRDNTKSPWYLPITILSILLGLLLKIHQTRPILIQKRYFTRYHKTN